MKYILNNIKKTSLAVVALSLAFASCQDDDTIAKKGKPVASVMVNTKTVTEGETATFDFALDYAVSEKLDIRIDLLDDNGNIVPVTEPIGDPNSGNGMSPLVFEDFNVPYPTWFDSGWFAYGYLGGSGYVATFPAYTENFQINIETIQDVLPEGTKSVSFKLTATSLMTVLIDQVITVNIENYVSDDLTMRLDWDGDYIADACGDLDFDLELFDGAFGYHATSYTGCPEEITLAGTDPDDTYALATSIWDNFYAGGLTDAIPASVTFSKAGVYNVTYDLSNVYDLTTAGASGGNNNYQFFTIEKTGTTYTITDPSSAPVVSGRVANYRK